MNPASRASSAEPHDGSVLGWLLLLGPGTIWGASFLFIAEGLRAIGPFGVTFFRILVGFATLGLVPAARRRVPREAWGWIALLGVIWLAFPLNMFPFAEQRISSALTGMLNGATPISVAFVASVLARRPPSRAIALGLAVGAVGTVLVGLPAVHQGGSSAAGVAMVLAAIVSYGLSYNLARPLQQRYGALPVIWRAQALALVLTAPLGLPDLLAARWTPGPLLSLLALGALGTGVAYALAAMAAGRLGATKASATIYLIPPVSLALGIVVRGERVAILSVVGAAICLAGAWLVRRGQAHR
ncbi:MAG: DMT family transporter [Hyphomicrobiales bacterium]